jgi:hypothetical protein
MIVAVACSGTSAPAPAPNPPRPRPVDARALDAAVDAAAVAPALGGACSKARACDGDRMCFPLPGGYCTSFCGLTGGPCEDGACVETPRAGELCLARCGSDADCRVAEGYLCDPQWNACMIPNTATIVPRSCPAPAGLARDPAFAPSTALSSASSPGLYQLEPSAVVADDGSLVALYLTRGPITEGNALGLARIDAANRVSQLALSTGRESAFDPWLARDARGTLYAVWLGFDGRSEHQEIALATSTDRGTTWSKPVPVHEPGDCAADEPDCLDKPMIAVGPDPQHRGSEIVYVVYSASGLRVRASRDHGATFGPPRTPLVGIYGDLAVGADGTLHLVTVNGGPGGAYGSADQTVEYASSSDGGATFTDPLRVSGSGESIPFFFSNPSVALDNARRWIYLVYARGTRDAKWDLVVAASKDKGKTWKRTRIGDDPACAIHMVPNLAVDPKTGLLHVAWYDSRGPRFAHAVCTPGAATCKQVGRINDVPFAALSTVRHGAKWIGEYESLVIDNARRILHATWSQPVDEAGKIVTRIFHARARLP